MKTGISQNCTFAFKRVSLQANDIKNVILKLLKEAGNRKKQHSLEIWVPPYLEGKRINVLITIAASRCSYFQ